MFFNDTGPRKEWPDYFSAFMKQARVTSMQKQNASLYLKDYNLCGGVYIGIL